MIDLEKLAALAVAYDAGGRASGAAFYESIMRSAAC